MKKLILFLLFVSSSNALATELPPDYATDFPLLAAGVLTQYPVTHEIGHYAGLRMFINGPEISYSEQDQAVTWKKELSRQERNTMTATGFILPMIISEVMIDTSVPKDNPYVMGLILGPLIHNVTYIVQDLTGSRDDKYNDIEQLERNGIEREVSYPLLLVIPAAQVYRLFTDKGVKKKCNYWLRIEADKSSPVVTVGYNF